MTATREEIVHHFLDTYRKRGWTEMSSFNWGLEDRANRGVWAEEYDEELGSPAGDRLGYWDVDADTYINGIMLTIDLDYYQGFMLEVVERESGVVSYVAIATFHGWNRETGEWDHDSMWYPADCGQFGDRVVDQSTACQWAAGAIFGMCDSYTELRSSQPDE